MMVKSSCWSWGNTSQLGCVGCSCHVWCIPEGRSGLKDCLLIVGLPMGQRREGTILDVQNGFSEIFLKNFLEFLDLNVPTMCRVLF